MQTRIPGRSVTRNRRTLDPLTPLTRCLPGFASVSEGNLQAVEPYREMFDMDPGNPMARLFYLWILALNRRQDAVATVLEGFSHTERETVPARVASSSPNCWKPYANAG